MQGTYTRWTRRMGEKRYRADLLGLGVEIVADEGIGVVEFDLMGEARTWDADTARMIGVRLIEAANLCSVDQVTRVTPAG